MSMHPIEPYIIFTRGQSGEYRKPTLSEALRTLHLLTLSQDRDALYMVEVCLYKGVNKFVSIVAGPGAPSKNLQGREVWAQG